MKVSREKAAENRERIIDAAGTLFRANGFSGIGVADIMKAAELTHGGFYGHFASKDDLAAQAAVGDLAEEVVEEVVAEIEAHRLIELALRGADRQAVGAGGEEPVDGAPPAQPVHRDDRPSLGQRADAAVRAEVAGIVDNPPTADELKRAKDSILNSFIFNYDSKPQVLSQQMTYAFYGLPADFLEHGQEVAGSAHAHQRAAIGLAINGSDDLDTLLAKSFFDIHRDGDKGAAAPNQPEGKRRIAADKHLEA